MATTTKSTKKKSASRAKAASAGKKTAKKTSAKSKATSSSTSKTTKSSAVKVEVTRKAVPTKEVKKSNVFDEFRNLRKWNFSLSLLFIAQAVAIVLLSADRLLPVTTNFLTVDSISDAGSAPVLVPATRHLFDVNVAYLIVAFFVMSAIAHFSIATWYRKKYEANLNKGMNKARWIEYSISASTMILAIAMIAGVYDLSTLLMMFGLTAVMNLCGLVMEKVNYGREKVDWSAYIVGCIAGIIPWIVYAIYIGGSAKYGEGTTPNFVYAILVSIFLLFNIFALNMYKQYKKQGRWADYLFGEKVYMVLSLVAKTTLAWLVFAGTLRP